MTARTTHGGSDPVESSRHGKMSAHWNRAFAVLLGLSLTTAALSVVVVQQIESTFVSATDEVSRETASYDQIVGALTQESAAAHLMLDFGSPVSARVPRRRRSREHRFHRRSGHLRRGHRSVLS